MHPLVLRAAACMKLFPNLYVGGLTVIRFGEITKLSRGSGSGDKIFREKERRV